MLQSFKSRILCTRNVIMSFNKNTFESFEAKKYSLCVCVHEQKSPQEKEKGWGGWSSWGKSLLSSATSTVGMWTDIFFFPLTQPYTHTHHPESLTLHVSVRRTEPDLSQNEGRRGFAPPQDLSGRRGTGGG